MANNSIAHHLKNFFQKGHQRSVRAKREIALSFLYKMISVGASFLLIPLTINYINPTQYGIWLTLMSIVSWVNFTNLGLGHGLRNKLAIARAEGDFQLARIYVSTTYSLLAIIISVVFCIFLVANQFVDWREILNIPTVSSEEISQLVFIVFSTFSVQFVVRLIDIVFLADQKPSLVRLVNTTNSLIGLAGIYFISKTTESSLLLAGTVLSCSNIVFPVAISVYYYSKKYKTYRPSLKFIDFSYAGSLFNLGIKFFILQLAAIIVFTTDNMIITQLLGPAHVTSYNLAFKFFGILTIAFTIITSPFWSAITEAYEKDDYKWIKHTTKKLLMIWGLFSLIAIGLIPIAPYFYEIWIGEKVTSGIIKIPILLNIGMCTWVIMAMFTMIFGNFVSGVSKVHISLYFAVFVSIINIPLSIFLVKYFSLGSAGVIFATALGTIPQVVIQPIQYLKIINKKASGIWNK